MRSVDFARSGATSKLVRGSQRSVNYVNLTSMRSYASLGTALLFGLVLAFFFINVFGTRPFLQQEMIGQAYWWNSQQLSFLETLFEPEHTDSYPGRFRYVEYLSEALYWNLMTSGWLPRDLYDYFSINLILLATILIYLIANVRGLSSIHSLLCSSLFLLSCPSFMVSTWHFRKAKVIAVVLLLVLTYLKERLAPRWVLLTVVVIGILTDPFFILLAPLVFLIGVVTSRRHWKTLIVGYLLGAVAVVVLNGVVGPLFSENCQLILTHIPKKPEAYLSFGNIVRTFDILRDILYPLSQSTSLYILVLGCVGIVFFVLIKEAKSKRYLICFLAALPISAFLVRPAPSLAMYAGYYGIVTFTLFVLAWVDVFRFLEKRDKPILKLFSYVIFLSLIVIQQSKARAVFDVWEWKHFQTPMTRVKFARDYQLLSKVRSHFETSSHSLEINLDLNRLKYLSFRRIYDDGETGLERERTNLAYVLIPVLFDREINSGKLKILF